MPPPFEPPLALDELAHILPFVVGVGSPLGQGGQGILFRLESDQGSHVLKVYRSAHRVRAERECNLLTELRSPYLVRLVRWGTAVIRGEECVYTVTEYVDGTPLDQLLRTKVLEEGEARILGCSIASAIDTLWLHARIVHRDIKPGNIMLEPDGAAVLLDLGVAKHSELVTLTTWGVAWGTPGYMSPEQARARRGITFKSDLYSLGIVLYEAVSGKHPFAGRQELIGTVKPTPLREVAHVSDHLDRIVHRLLEADPLDRPTTCEEVMAELRGR